MRILLSAVLLLTLADCLFSKESLVIISPHRKSIQAEFIPPFERFYKQKYGSEISVEWLDQGGASDDLKFILGRFEKNPATSRVDLIWGGGEHPYYELDKRDLLLPHILPEALKKEVPSVAAGVRVYNDSETWHAGALSSFGIFYNKFVLQMKKPALSAPESWSDLADAKFFNNLSNADPRQSSSNVTMNFVILQAFGWEKGWEVLTRIAGNTRAFRHSSVEPIRDIVSGDAAAGIVIGYYANAKIGDLGPKKLGFSLPVEQTIINPDPIAILKGAPNKVQAGRFVEFLLSSEAQKLLLLPKGAKGGPAHGSLARIAVNRRSYEETSAQRISLLNPFSMQIKPMALDTDRVTRVQFVLTDLIGTILIDHHQELKTAWESVIKRGLTESDLKELSKMPDSVDSVEKLDHLATKWEDPKFRNSMINQWHGFAKVKYGKLLSAG